MVELYSARAHSAVLHQQHTNPKRKRGNGLLASLALRVSIIRARAEHKSKCGSQKSGLPTTCHHTSPQTCWEQWRRQCLRNIGDSDECTLLPWLNTGYIKHYH